MNSLIRWQNTKAATAGFATGLGGLFTLPVAIPADIAATIYIQIKMIIAIAIMYGVDVRDERVRTLVYLCLVASSTRDLMSQLGLKAGGRIFMQSLRKIPPRVFYRINQKVGIRLLAKLGRRGALKFGRLAPFVGGFVNGTLDMLATRSIARVAKKTFKELAEENQITQTI
ncbi:MAG: EcsC family protein [Bacteroidales bacterium]|nr:EcsC family protein [Bacteroidales bacterium]